MTKYRETSAFQFLYIQSVITISKSPTRTKGKKLHSLTLVIMTQVFSIMKTPPKHQLSLKIKSEFTFLCMKHFWLTLRAKAHTNRQRVTSLITSGSNILYFAMHYMAPITHYLTSYPSKQKSTTHPSPVILHCDLSKLF